MRKILVFILCFVGAGLLGQPIPYGKEFQVNTRTEGDQENPRGTALQQGGFAICWEGPQEGAPYAGILGQVFAADGAKIGEEFQANTTDVFAQFKPQIIPLQGGGFLVVWEGGEQAGHVDGVRGRIFSREGEKTGDEFRINTYAGLNPGAYDPETRYTALADGGIILCWQTEGQDGSELGIYGRRLEQDGGMAGEEFRINTYTTGHQSMPQITSLADGGFVVCWASFGQDGDGEGVYGQLFSAEGSKKGGEFRINSSVEGYQWMNRIASLQEDGFAVIWITTDGGEFSSGIYGQCFSLDGQKTGEEFRLEQFREVGMWGPVLAPLGIGGFLVCWEMYNASAAGIYGQRFSSMGVKLGDDFPVNTCTRCDPTDLQIAILGNDSLLTCWMSAEQDGSGWGVYGQILASDGLKIGKEFRINTFVEGDQLFPVVFSLKDSGFVACWQSRGQDGSGAGVFAKRYPVSPILHTLVSFDLIQPSNGGLITTVNPVLSWHQASTRTVCYPWELHYSICIDDNPGFHSPRIVELDQDTTAVVRDLTPGTTYFWKVLAKNIACDSLWSSNTNGFFVSADATDIAEEKNLNQPNRFILHQNYPNPFNPETTIRFDLPETDFIDISIYDVSGKLVRILTHESRTAGSYSIKWDGMDSAGNPAPSGIYVCRMEVRSANGERFVQSVKMGLVR
jgi:hypothetical protein